MSSANPTLRIGTILLLLVFFGLPACGDTGSAAGGGDGGGSGSGSSGGGGRYHPDGFSDPSEHGMAMKMQTQDCRSCHGDGLEGGSSGMSCDTCHSDGWRTNCTFCHGGGTPGGAPPRDIDGTTDAANTRFPGHTAHVTDQNHAAFACTQCHAQVTDVLTPGHIFDATPGRAEISFAAGLSRGGNYNEVSGCTSIYCHGNGRQAGSSKRDDGPKSCSACHAGMTTPNRWGTLSGEHRRHLANGVLCGDCHTSVASGGSTIVDNALHVNGNVEADLQGTGVSVSNGRCTGRCHGKGHFFRGW